jgi:hypothetical protein
VEAVGVVDILDEGADAVAGVFEVGVGRAVGFLGFERLHEAFGLGVVVGIAWPAHGALKASLVEPRCVLARSVLDAAIGVVDEASRRIARFDRLVERVLGQARREMVVERPSHPSAREGVDDDGEIDESLRQPDIEPVLGLDPRMMSATHS